MIVSGNGRTIRKLSVEISQGQNFFLHGLKVSGLSVHVKMSLGRSVVDFDWLNRTCELF
jgi:hypothetical protein